jgi:mannose-6-phosphate isomerase-like protein (cupin superfamily)
MSDIRAYRRPFEGLQDYPEARVADGRGFGAATASGTRKEPQVTTRFIAWTIFLGVSAALIHGVVLLAQTITPPGTYISVEQWRKDLDASKPALGIVAGQTAAIAPNVVVRRRQAGPNNASVHTAEGDKQYVTEIYQILEGSGTYVTGGTMPDANNRTAGIKNGTAQDVKPGDFLIIPPGTAHWFSHINGQITYLEVRLPGDILANK